MFQEIIVKKSKKIGYKVLFLKIKNKKKYYENLKNLN